MRIGPLPDAMKLDIHGGRILPVVATVTCLEVCCGEGWSSGPAA
jgi:hypothetical protein